MGDQDNYCLLKLQNLMRCGVDGFRRYEDWNVCMKEEGQLKYLGFCCHFGFDVSKTITRLYNYWWAVSQ